MKSKKISSAIISCVMVLVLAFASFMLGKNVGKNEQKSQELRRLEFIINTYHENYYGATDDYYDQLVKGITDGYGGFYTYEGYEDLGNAYQGDSRSWGFTVSNDLVLTDVVYNSPAFRAGVRAGGRIISINAQEVSSIADLNNILKDTPCAFVIDYEGTQKSYTFVKEDFRETFVYMADGEYEYYFENVDGFRMGKSPCQKVSGQILPQGYSYLRLKSFLGVDINQSYSQWKSSVDNSVGQVYSALNQFKLGDNRKLILDLRGNGGGYVSVFTSISSCFIGDSVGQKLPVQSTEYSNGNVEKNYSESTDKQDYNFEEIIILANSSTASASEAFIGALLDYDTQGIVKVVVEKNDNRQNYSTYGKGVMQTFFTNEETGDVVKLTNGKISWPVSGECINGVGVGKHIARYESRIYEAKNGENQPIDALNYVVEGLRV